MATPGKGYSMKKQLIPHSLDELSTSTAPKRTATEPAPANPGMHHVAIPATHDTPGLLARGVSKTQSARALGADLVGEVGPGAVTPIKPHSQPGNVEDHPTHTARPFDPQASLPDNRPLRGEVKK
jgi:hypothetical protein